MRRDETGATLDIRKRDSRLVVLTLSGDEDAFSELVRLYYDRLRALVHYHLHREDELDDALQEIFLRAYQALPRFEKKANFYTWLYRIASNYCIDRLRKRRFELVSLDDDETHDVLESKIERHTKGPDEEFSQNERVKLVRIALSKLDPVYQNIILLREFEGLSYEELVETLEINMGTVKSRLARARAELREILEKMDVI